MAGEIGQWWPDKLKLLKANYETCKLKVRQDSLYCKLFILQLQNAFDEERFITQKYENKAAIALLQQAKQQVVDVTNEKEFMARKSVEDLSNVEGEWQTKSDLLVKEIESLQEEKENEIKSKDALIFEITKELEDLRRNKHRQTRSKESLVAENCEGQLGNERKLNQSIKTRQVLRDQNCEQTTASKSSLETQSPNDIVLRKAKPVSENGSGNCNDDTGESNQASDTSEKQESITGEGLLESELGSVLEVTEEMLKSCRRRSVVKRKKSEFCDLPHESSEGDTVEVSECEKQGKKRKERRVTFSGELEIKLPDGSKEVVEISVEDLSGQVETHDATEEDLSVFDDTLPQETLIGGDVDSKNRELGDIDVGTGTEEIAKVNMEEKDERNGNEVKNETESCVEVGRSDEFDEETQRPSLDENLAKENKRRKKIQKKKGKKDGENKSKQKNQDATNDVENNGDNGNDRTRDEEKRRFSVEADILLSADRQARGLNFGCRNTDQQRRKTPTPEDEIQMKSYENNSDELPNSQLPETCIRGSNNQPRRGLRRHTYGIKSSKRLLHVFGDEPGSNKVMEETQAHQREKKAKRNTRENKDKTSKPVAKNKKVDAPNSENSKENVEKKNLHAKIFEDETDSESDLKEVQKPKTRKASRKTKKIGTSVVEREDELESQNNRGGKRKRGTTTTKDVRKLLGVENEGEVGGNKNKEIMDDPEQEAQNCSPNQLSPFANEVQSSGKRKRADTPVEATDEIEQERNPLDKNNGDDEDEHLVEKKNGKRARKRKSRKVNKAIGSGNCKGNEGDGELQTGGRRKRRIIELNDDDDEGEQELGQVDENKDEAKIENMEETKDAQNVADENRNEKQNVDLMNHATVGSDENNSDENKPRRAGLRSTKRKSPEPNEHRDEHNENGNQELNPNDSIEFDDKHGSGEKVEEMTDKQETIRNSDEIQQRKGNLRSKKRRSPEPDEQHHENNENGNQECDDKHDSNGKVEEINDKQETIRNSDEIEQRKGNLRSKKRKSPQPEQHDDEIKDLNESKKDSRVEEELQNEDGVRENINEGLNNRRHRGKDTKVVKKETDDVNVAKKVKSKEEKEAVDDDDQTNNGVTLNLQGEDKEEEMQSGDVAEQVDDEHKIGGKKTNKLGKKLEVVDTKENDINENEERQSGDVAEQVDDEDKIGGKKTNKLGKKREVVETKENDINEISKDGDEEEGKQSGDVAEKMDDEDRNGGKKTNKKERKSEVVETKENDMDEINKNDNGEEGRQIGKVAEKVDDEDKNGGRKTNKRGRKRGKVETKENYMNEINKDGSEEEEMQSGDLAEKVDDEDKNGGRKTNKRGRKRDIVETKENDMNEINNDGGVCGRRKSTKKTNEEEVANKKEPEISGEMSKPEKPVKKKRRTLYSSSSTFINSTSSVFQETLLLNQTRNSSGMPPSLSAFMKAFIVPKLKKK